MSKRETALLRAAEQALALHRSMKAWEKLPEYRTETVVRGALEEAIAEYPPSHIHQGLNP